MHHALEETDGVPRVDGVDEDIYSPDEIKDDSGDALKPEHKINKMI
jgi:hypothetical protein